MSTTGFILSLCFVLSHATKHGVDQSKRLLLNDPDVANKIAAMEITIQKLSESVTLLQQASTNQGSSYIRWGRKQCSGSNTQTLYSGFTSGQEYRHGSYYGGPANVLCLPDNPDPSNRTGFGSSLLYGSEFEDSNFFGPHAQDEDVPCAVCISTNTSVSLMVPGKSTCFSGWTLEYSGYLASAAYSHKASSYICVDSNPEYLQGGERNNDENLLYATTLKCGSMPCPPYTNNQAVNCVVCSN